jgi:hypothetical protein
MAGEAVTVFGQTGGRGKRSFTFTPRTLPGSPGRPKDLAPTIRSLQATGASLRGIASALNERGIKTARGSEWTAMAVKRVLATLSGLEA